MKVRLTIGRSLREYANVIVEATDPEMAAAYVQRLLDGGPFGPHTITYCDLVNTVSWDPGDETFDERVLADSAEAHADQDEETDVTVPGGWQPPPPAPDDAPPAVWWIVTLREHGDDEDSLVIVEGADEDAAVAQAKEQFSGHSGCEACGHLPCLESCGACDYPVMYITHVVRCGAERPMPTHAQPSTPAQS